MSKHDIEAFEGDLNSFEVLGWKAVYVIPDDVGGLVEFEDELRFTWMSQVGEDIADLSFDIVAVGFKQD